MKNLSIKEQLQRENEVEQIMIKRWNEMHEEKDGISRDYRDKLVQDTKALCLESKKELLEPVNQKLGLVKKEIKVLEDLLDAWRCVYNIKLNGKYGHIVNDTHAILDELYDEEIELEEIKKGA